MSRPFLVLLILISTISASLSFAAPAFAGTLSGATWTVMDPRTNIQGNRYDYAFTTATAGSVARVSASVPAGTTGSNRYLANPRVDGNGASTPDSATNSITGDIDIRAWIAPTQWSVGRQQAVLAKFQNGGQRSYRFEIGTGGQLNLVTTNDGVTDQTSGANIPGIVDGQSLWVRTTRIVNDGAGNRVTKFYTSTNGTLWAQFASIVEAGATSIFDSSAPVEVGSMLNNNFSLGGKILFASAASGISGTTNSPSTCASTGVVSCFDPSNAAVGATTWSSAAQVPETWTINRSGASLLPADIASDLSVMNVSGVPTGGAAQLREIDRVAVYLVPTASIGTVAAGAAVKVGLAGMTNTFTAGSYSSSIATTDSTGVAIDSASSNTVGITGPIITSLNKAPPVYTGTNPSGTAEVLPQGLAVNGTSVYVSDAYSSTILKVDASNSTFTSVAGNGISATQNGAALATATQINTPWGVITDGSNFWYSDTSNLIRKVAADGTVVTIAGGGANTTYNFSGSALSASLSGPRGMALDASGNIYFANFGDHTIRKIDTAGQISTIAGDGTRGFLDSATATTGKLRDPSDVWVATDGTVYVADTANNRIRAISNGALTTVVGTGSSSPFNDNVASSAANLSAPLSVTGDALGNLYIADTGNNRLRMVSSGTVTTVAGGGASYVDGGSPTATSLSFPTQVRLDGTGKIYVADQNSGRVRVVSGGTISSVIGSVNPTFSGEGQNIAVARLYRPNDLISDGKGNLYVNDTLNNRIRKIDQWGTITTVVGTGRRSATADGQLAATSSVGVVGNLALDSLGNLYFDEDYGKVRKVDTAGVLSTIATGSNPGGLAADATHLYYADNDAPCQVWKVPLSGGTKVLVAGNGICGTTAGNAADPTTISLGAVRGLSFDPSGALILTDFTSMRIRRIDPNTGAIRVVAGGGASTSTNVLATDRNIGNPGGAVVFDGTGYGYIATLYAVYKFRIGGSITPIVGQVTNGPSGDGGPVEAATVIAIRAVAISNGQLYLSSSAASRIRKIADTVPMAPLVNNDSINAPSGTARSWPILSNDWSRSNQMDPSSVTILSQPTNGTVTLTKPTTEASTMQAVYTSAPGYTGADSFTYRACDTTRVQCATATVNVTVGSNQFTTVAGGVAEGYAKDIGMLPQDVTRFGRYIFISDINNYVVRRLDTYSNQVVTVLGTGVAGTSNNVVATAGNIGGTRGIAVAPDGTINVADFDTQLVRRISPAGVATVVAGDGNASNAGDGLAATSASLTGPLAVAYGPDGSLFIGSGQKIRKVGLNGVMSTAVGTGTSGYSGEGGDPTLAMMTGPRGIVFNSRGEMFFTDSGNDMIRKVAGSVITRVAGTGTNGFAGDGGSALSALMNSPRGLAIDASDNLYVADTGSSRIRKIIDATGVISSVVGGGAAQSDGASALSSSTPVASVAVGSLGDLWVGIPGYARLRYVNAAGLINTVGGNGSNYYSGDALGSRQTQLNFTNGDTPITADATGNLYVSEVGENRIRKIDAATGLVSTFAGNGTSGNSATQISAPQQASFGPDGLLYFGEYNNCQVRRRNGDGSLTVIAGNGVCGTSPTLGGSATATSVNRIYGTYAAANGDVYFSDINSRVYRVRSGTITSVAGTGTNGFSGDGGLAVDAQIGSVVRTINADGQGNLYLADTNNNRVRMIDTAGFITTVAGNGGTSYAGEASLATDTSINVLKGIAFDGAGNIFLSEVNGSRIRKIDRATGTISTVAGDGVSNYRENVTTSNVRTQQRSGSVVVGNDLYVVNTTSNRLQKLAGAASTAVNNVAASRWSVVPADVGHANLRERFTVTPSTTTMASKITTTMPTGFTVGTPTVVDSFGISGTVTAAVTGTTLTLTFPSQQLAAGVPIAISFEGITNGGNSGAYVSYVTLYDGAGTGQIGWSNSNVVSTANGGAPPVNGAGFGSIWKRKLSTTATAPANLTVSPSGTTDATSVFTIATAGNANASTSAVAATAMMADTKTFTAITPDITSGVAAASFATNRWGVQATTTSGVNQGATGNGVYTGIGSSAPIFTGVSGSATLTLTARARVNYLQPAGTYKSTLSWRLYGGV